MWYNYEIAMIFDLRWLILAILLVFNYFYHKAFKPRYLEYTGDYSKAITEIKYIGTYIAIALVWFVAGNIFLW